jgi:hypothetical protein
MAFSSSGSISLADLKTKLGGGASPSLQDYFQNSATNYSKLIQGIPTSGSGISLNDFRGKSPVVVFNATGANQTLTIPSTTTMIYVKAWGAGGGGQNVAGGPGGFSSGYITVTPNEVITIKVGSRGLYGNGVNLPNSYPDGGRCYAISGIKCASGGGSSSVWRNAAADASIVAGGGGGGGNAQSPYSEANTYGGAGGGTNALNGTKCRSFEFGGWQAIDNGVGHFSGNGGTQSAGGAAGGNCSYWVYRQSQYLPSAGSKYLGGFTGQWGGGAGGGGYYGGGGGGVGDGGAAAGGGGSGYIGGCLTTAGGAPANAVTTTGVNNSAPPNNTDFHYVSGIAAGGAAAGQGGNGLVVISYVN